MTLIQTPSSQVSGTAKAQDVLRPKVLLVDDQPARLLTYEAILEGIGVTCTRALSGAEALERLLKDTFAVIVLDVSMPDMDGFETARRIREHPRFERTPIIFVTGVHITQLDTLRGYEVGAIDYIPVPIVPEILRSKVTLLVELYTRRTELQALNRELKAAHARLEAERNEAMSSSRLHAQHSKYPQEVLDARTEIIFFIEAIRGESGVISHWRYLDANPDALEFLNRSRADLVGARLDDKSPGVTEPPAPLCTRVLAERHPHRYQARIGARDFLISLYPVGENTVIASGIDVTARDDAKKTIPPQSYAALGDKEWFGAVLNSMNEEVYLTDVHQKYVYANPAALRTFGHGSVEGMNVERWAERFEIYRPDGTRRPTSESPPLRALNGEVVRDEEQIVRMPRTGELRYRQVSSAPVRDSAGEIIGAVSVVRDLTENRRTQEERRKSDIRSAALLRLSDRFRVLEDPAELAYAAAEILGETLRVSRCGYGTVDAEAETITIERDWNAPGGESIAGLLHFREYGTYIDDLKRGDTVVCANVDSDLRTISTASALKAIQVQSFVNMPVTEKEGTVALLYLTHTHPRDWSEDELRFIREVAERTRIAVERRRSERALAADLELMGLLRDLSARLVSEADAKTLFDEILAAAISITAADGGTLQLLRQEQQALVFATTRGLDPQLTSHFEQVDARSGSSCGRALAARKRVVTRFDVKEADDPDGSLRLHFAYGLRRAQSTPLISRSGRIIGMFSTHWRTDHAMSAREERFLDLLARQAADLIERLETERTLHEADRRKDEFIAMLSHEIRNPLVPIRTGISLLKGASDSSGMLARIQPIMERQMGHVVRLIDDLLDISRITAGHFELRRSLIKLHSLIDTALEAHRDAVTANGKKLTVHIDDPDRLLDVDTTRFTQVISNLLSNATKFTSDSGHITIIATTDTPTPGAAELVLKVADTGLGISPERLPGIFDLFNSASSEPKQLGSQRGLGVGLALARRIVEMHGGTLEARSEGLGRGSEFVLRAPVLVVDYASAVKTPNRIVIPAGTRVLVVDDNRDAADLLVALLEDLGAEAKAGYDGRSALRMADEVAPRIVILDIGLPDIDGYQVCRQLRQRFGHAVSIVALTGWGQEQDKQQAAAAGFDQHLTKPPYPEALATLMLHLLER